MRGLRASQEEGAGTTGPGAEGPLPLSARNRAWAESGQQRPRVGETHPGAAALASAIAACQRAAGTSRALDAQIALAVFPALGDLPAVDEGIWVDADGTRVRALRYSASRVAAATLVPPGCWIEPGERGNLIAGAHGEWAGTHEVDAIALCIAALSAKIAELSRLSRKSRTEHQDTP
jgi:hypothetical protein